MTVKDDYLDVTLSTGDVLPANYLAGIRALLDPLDRTAAEIAASVTPTNYQYEPGDARRYGAVGDGVADDAAAIANWLTVGVRGVALTIPPGVYDVSSGSVFTTGDDLRIRGTGRGLVTLIGHGIGSGVSFIKTTGNLYVDGVTFEDFYGVFQIGALASETDVEITNCGNVDSIYFVFRQDADANTVGLKSLLLQNNHIDHSGIATSTGTRGLYLPGRYTDVRLINNKIQNVNGRPIVIGHNDYADQDFMVRASVIGNTISDITGQNGDETQGILVYGRNAVISGNTLENITSAAATGCEGIYTKCRFATITGNSLYNAGDDEAAINVKGSNRSQTVSPQGYAVVCANNNIFFTANATAYGIHIQQDDVLCEGNHVEGAGLYGIYTNLAYDNITIRNNRIIKGTGERGISCIHSGTGLCIVGNEIIELDTRDSIANAYGIIIDPQSSPGITDIDIVGNVIRLDAGNEATTSVRGIHLSRTQALNRVRVNRNKISATNAVTTRGISISGAGGGTDWEIQDNDIQTDENPFEVTGGELPPGLDFRQSWRFQTAAAGPASAMTFALADEASYTFELRAVAVLSDGAEQAMYHREALYFRNGGGATIVGAVQDIGTPQEVTGAWNATFGTSSNNIQTLLTGEASHTINWRLWVHILGVSAA